MRKLSYVMDRNSHDSIFRQAAGTRNAYSGIDNLKIMAG